MKPINTITGSGAPLPLANVDTDQIMPKNFLKRVERSGYGQFVFWDWATDAEGSPNPEFVLNKPEYQNATILLTGENFGSGSSREHAPWGIEDWGFRAVIAPSFADIFYSNCCNIGLLPVALKSKEVQYLLELAEAEPDAQITIDLPNQSVTADGFEARFEMDIARKHRLVEGLDLIGTTLLHEDLIAEFEATRPSHKPSLA
jgi:3-isopropylmalate/(R)-2-methylmalate dehydratase small subunit